MALTKFRTPTCMLLIRLAYNFTYYVYCLRISWVHELPISFDLNHKPLHRKNSYSYKSFNTYLQSNMEKLLSAGMTYLKLLKPEVSFFFRAEEADIH